MQKKWLILGQDLKFLNEMQEKYRRCRQKILKFRPLLYISKYFSASISVLFRRDAATGRVWCQGNIVLISSIQESIPAQVASQCRSLRCKWLVSTEFRCKKLQLRKGRTVGAHSRRGIEGGGWRFLCCFDGWRSCWLTTSSRKAHDGGSNRRSE